MRWMETRVEEFDPADVEKLIGDVVHVTTGEYGDEQHVGVVRHQLGRLMSVSMVDNERSTHDVRFHFKNAGDLMAEGPSSKIIIETTAHHDRMVARREALRETLRAIEEERSRPPWWDRTIASIFGRSHG